MNKGKTAGIWQGMNIALLCLVAVFLIGLQFKILGVGLLILGVVMLLLCTKSFAKEIFLIYLALGILGITEITTDISNMHMLSMGFLLICALAVPYFVSKYVYKDDVIQFEFHSQKKWKKEILLYILLGASIAYFLIPFYLKDTGAYLNWSVQVDTFNIIKLFIGTNALGIWDELLFINIVLTILRRHLRFFWANIAQAVLFTAFLHELGFTGWGYIMIYVFALSQGAMFRKTQSLFQIIIFHLTVDFILFLALINAHHPDLVNVFVT